MHFYKFNIGDYSSHTQHLSESEDLCYRRMLDYCYLNEIGLPESIEEIARLIRMRTHCECIANVLREFFYIENGVYKNKRVEVDLFDFKGKSDKASESAKARWAKHKDFTDANAMRTQCDGNAKQEPRTKNQEPRTNKTLSATADVVAVFEHWQNRMNHPSAKLDDKRKKLIKKAIKLGYSTDDLIAAIDGCAKSPFHMGQNDRGAVYDGLDLILRDASKIDGFIKNNSLTQQQGGSLNENSRNHDRISQLSKTAAGRMQLNIERELAEIKASRQRGDNTLVGSDEECVLAQVDFDVSGRRD